MRPCEREASREENCERAMGVRPGLGGIPGAAARIVSVRAVGTAGEWEDVEGRDGGFGGRRRAGREAGGGKDVV